jgi:sodium-independent sulfate anion transporter 11
MLNVWVTQGGAVTGLMVILALQFLTPYFAYIPKASLAAIISGSVIFMVDPKIILPLWRSKSKAIRLIGSGD